MTNLRPPELITLHVNLLEEEPAIEDCSIDLVVTSYPYKRKDGYSAELMEALGRLLGRVMRPGARLFLNGGQLRESFSRPFEARDLIEEHSGLVAGQTIAWVKSVALPCWRDGVLERAKALAKFMDSSSTWCSRPAAREKLADLQRYLKGPGDLTQRGHYQPLGTEKVLNYAWEPIFTFYKPPELDLNRRAIGAPFTDKSNMKRGTRGQHGDLHCAGDVWFIPYRTTGAKAKKASSKTAHAYGFPEELVERCIKVANMARGCTVYDPFLGSGTTALVARRLGMHTIGTDSDLEALKLAQERYESEVVGDGRRREEEVDVQRMR